MGIQLRKKPFIRSLVFFVTVMFFSGCGIFPGGPLISVPFIKDKWKDTEYLKKIKAEKKAKAEKLKNKQKKPTGKEYKETIQQLPLLIKGGKKPLLIDQQEEFSPNSGAATSPCIDPKTGKEKNFLLADLRSELIPLSYSNMDRVMTSLQVMGVKTIKAAGPISKPYTVIKRGKATMLPVPKLTHEKIGYPCSELPVFFKPDTAPVKTLTEVLQGPSASTTGSRFSMVNMGEADYGLNESLVAFYHPSNQKRYNNIKKTIHETLDAAPIQVYIESMVLEVNESGLDELGVLLKSNRPGANQTFEAGILSPLSPSSMTSSSPLFSSTISSIKNATALSEALSMQIQALISKGSAEVLSRPSVLTLNNRPAVIEVTEQSQFPIRTASTGYSGVVTLSYSFEEVTPGIILQIRPRVSDRKNEVALEIDVQVKALVTANDGVAVDDDGDTVATKPGSSTRRVHTFALVPNKTPIIIGGLVSKDNERTENKLPWLSDIPLIGPLFGATSASNEKKEVIIVMTPHIIRNSNDIGIQTPKDTEMFDDTGMDLFRDSYRVRAEDVFDLGFVYESKEFKKYRNYVINRSETDEAFAKTPLGKSYSGSHFPGGDGLIARMVYDIVKKRNLHDPVSRDKIILTEHTGDGNFERVTFLEKAWQQAQFKSLPSNENGQSQEYGIALTFSKKEANSSVQPHVTLRILPLEEIALLEATNEHLQNTNQIFISKEKDLNKIRMAIVVREVLKLNRNKHIFGYLNEFGPGTKFILPVIKETRHFLLDAEVATIFYQTKYYYQILEQSLRKSFRLIEEELEKESLKAKVRTSAVQRAAAQRAAAQRAAAAKAAIRQRNFTEKVKKPSSQTTKKVIKTPKTTVPKTP
ncbi:MAG: type II and III secretion system protein [Nitrospinaceae bacterium]|nr:type II and III secretion system protein [Nitrospinaceae bacterium]